MFQFAAIVNINLAVVNLLPFPALDGGYLALILLEARGGKKLPKEVEQTVMACGLLLLMATGVAPHHQGHVQPGWALGLEERG